MTTTTHKQKPESRLDLLRDEAAEIRRAVLANRKRATGQSFASFAVATSVTFVLFFIEALMHVQLGETDEIALGIPDKDKLLKMVLLILLFSFLSAVIVTIIKKLLGLN